MLSPLQRIIRKRKEEREKRKGERGAIAPAVLATNQQPVTRMLRPTLQRAFALAKINLGGDTNIVVANAKAPTEDNKKEKRGKRKEEREKRKGERGAIAPAVLATNQQPVTRMLRPTPWGGCGGDGLLKSCLNRGAIAIYCCIITKIW
ncbi:hypothetical protein AM228_10815 [Planktothricoides sp. SR001]|nr:hypothetical protein AM228_10815 [Planktothricoides sp. SR001]